MQPQLGTRPRLLVVTSTFPRWAGDSEPRFVLDLCRSLGDAYDITVLAPHCSGASQCETLEGVRVVRFRYAPAPLQQLAYEGGMLAKLRVKPWLWLVAPFYILAQSASVAAALRQGSMQLVHAHWLIPGGLAARLGKLLARSRAPLIVTAHGSDVVALRGPLASALLRWVASGSHRIGVVSDALGQQLAARGVVPAQMTVLPMGVAMPAAATPAREPSLLAFAGRMVPGKGVERLLDAFGSVAREHADARLELVGDGPELPRYREQAQALVATDRVRFRGALPNAAVQALFARAAAAVVPSDDEGLGLVALEAMATGCAVIATRLPSLEGVLRDGHNARTVPPGDRDALAAAMLELLGAPDRAASLGARARADVAARFSWPAVATRHRAVYEDALSAR